MEDKDIKLREVIRGLVREMLVSIKEEGDGDYSSLSPDMVKATAAQQQAADAGAAALAAESPAGEEEQWAAASGDEGEGLDEGWIFNVKKMSFKVKEENRELAEVLHERLKKSKKVLTNHFFRLHTIFERKQDNVLTIH